MVIIYLTIPMGCIISLHTRLFPVRAGAVDQ